MLAKFSLKRYTNLGKKNLITHLKIININQSLFERVSKSTYTDFSKTLIHNFPSDLRKLHKV